jgi:hypothetical protein
VHSGLVGSCVSVIRQLCYEFLLRQLGNAGGVDLVDPLLPQHLSAPVLTAINEHQPLQQFLAPSNKLHASKTSPRCKLSHIQLKASVSKVMLACIVTSLFQYLAVLVSQWICRGYLPHSASTDSSEAVPLLTPKHLRTRVLQWNFRICRSHLCKHQSPSHGVDQISQP